MRPARALRRDSAAPARGVAWLVRPALIAAVAISLLAGIAGGLLRAGVAMPGAVAGGWPAQAVTAHAALMMCGFLGTVIGIERAVAVKWRWAFLAPVASGLGGLALISGHETAAHGFLVAAAVLFAAVNAGIVRRQAEVHTWLLLVAAAAWLTGNALFAAGADAGAVHPWWFAFLVLTISAERLEMARLMRRGRGTQALLLAVLALMAAGAALSLALPRAGGVLYGASLVLLAAWFGAFDIARRTVRAGGLSRYMAVCLLGGYAWLAVAGAAWMAAALGLPARDAALHALGLGFIVSMVMGHAPVILPAVAGVKLRFGGFFYVPLGLLHASLAVRLGPGLSSWTPRAGGAVFNAAAIALFAATVLGAALAWRFHHGAPRAAKEFP